MNATCSISVNVFPPLFCNTGTDRKVYTANSAVEILHCLCMHVGLSRFSLQVSENSSHSDFENCLQPDVSRKYIKIEKIYCRTSSC